MSRNHLARIIAITAMTTPGFATAASAAPVEISFKPGQTCWTYSGPDWQFIAEFPTGQRLIATATGDSIESDGKIRWTVTNKEDVVVQRPPSKDTVAIDDDGRLTIPAGDRYLFTLLPAANHGNEGRFVICKL